MLPFGPTINMALGADFDRAPEALLASPELILLLLALGDVDDCREHHGAFICLDRIKADFHRKLATVLSEGIKIQPDAHGPGGRIGEE